MKTGLSFKKKNVVLGIDPGIATTGWSVVEKNKGDAHLLGCGVIRTKTSLSYSSRLHTIYDNLKKIVLKYKPNILSLEQVFFAKNVKTAINVGEARGIAILIASQYHMDIAQYSPTGVKQALTGYGRAPKQQVQKIVKALLNLDKIPFPDDIADALAIALCHLYTKDIG